MGKKLGLCLTGGGARGGYQIGAMKALDELGILSNIHAYAGTSIGSANACVVASRGIKAAEDVWLNLPQENIPKIKPSKPKKPRIVTGRYSLEIFDKVMREAIDYEALKSKEVYITVSQGGPKDGGFMDLLKANFSHYVRKDSQVKYMPAHALDDETIHQCVMASCSIPLFFAPVDINDQHCFDGGMYDNIPVMPLIEAGCDEIIIVHLHKHRSRFFNPKKLAQDVCFHEIKHQGKELGPVLKFSLAHTNKLIELGYQETKAYFEAYQYKK